MNYLSRLLRKSHARERAETPSDADLLARAGRRPLLATAKGTHLTPAAQSMGKRWLSRIHWPPRYDASGIACKLQVPRARNHCAQSDGAVLLDGTAVPNGTQVFGVRPPDIDDGGVMDHGNHQIHPAIKPCL